MKVTAFFTSNGTPQTGLSPIIEIWTFDGTKVIDGESMTEVAGGFYYYDFTNYDEDEDYCIRADSVTLTGADRYMYSTNETAGVGKILKIEKGNWEIKRNQMIFYDTDGETALYTFDLKDKNNILTEKDVYKRIGV